MQGELTAPVFNIQTYCIHDGPGIRTTVFLKGCPLRCLWCANPESNESHPQLMFYQNKCKACGHCISACPQNAIHLVLPKETESTPFAKTDRTKCVNCGKCTEGCPSDAREIAGKYMTVSEIMAEVLKDKLFLISSGGGITISGGEALSHPDFSAALLKAAKENGLHAAIETSSFATRSVIDKVFSNIDLGLLDIKHMDDTTHEKLTGVSNKIILENIQHIYQDLHIPVIIRVPTIPGCNDDPHNIALTAKFVRDKLGTDVSIHLLPYHRLGESKRESIGEVSPEKFEVPTDSHMEMLKGIVESYGINTQIGG